MDTNPETPDGSPERTPAPGLRPISAEEKQPRRFVAVLTNLNRPLATGFLVTIGVIGALLVGSTLGPISTVLVYILLAMFLAIGLDPLVRLIERRGIRRSVAIAIVVGGLVLLAIVLVLLMLPPLLSQVRQFIDEIPESAAAIPSSAWFAALSPEHQATVLEALTQVADWLSAPSTIATLSGGVLAAGAGFVGGISASFVVVALTSYFLASLAPMKGAFYALAPARNRPRLQDLTERITDAVGRGLLGSLILSSLNAAAVFVLHLIIGLPYPALMAVVSFVLSLIPIFGSVIFWILGTLIALLTSPLQALIFAVGYLVYIQLESYVITPRVMNKAIEIPPALVLIGALAGGALMGVVGVLVALPVMASILLIIREVIVPRQDRKTSPEPDSPVG